MLSVLRRKERSLLVEVNVRDYFTARVGYKSKSVDMRSLCIFPDPAFRRKVCELFMPEGRGSRSRFASTIKRSTVRTFEVKPASTVPRRREPIRRLVSRLSRLRD